MAKGRAGPMAEVLLAKIRDVAAQCVLPLHHGGGLGTATLVVAHGAGRAAWIIKTPDQKTHDVTASERPASFAGRESCWPNETTKCDLAECPKLAALSYQIPETCLGSTI